MVGFVIGVFVGGVIGVCLMALCSAASKSESEQRTYPSQLEGHFEFDTDTELPSDNPFYRKVAYSKYFGSFIKVVTFEDTLHWEFALCDELGYTKGLPMKAKSSVFEFEWREIGHGL